MSKPIVRMFLGVMELLLILVALQFLYNSFAGISGLMTESNRQQANLQEENGQEDLLSYAGATITGTDVEMLVKEAGFYNICVKVNNGTGSVSYYYTDYTLANRQMDYDKIISDVIDENGNKAESYLSRKVSGYEQYYICPIDTYKCELITSQNGTIVGIECTKS